MEIDKNLYQEIKEYCNLNGIKPKDYINTLLRKAFMQDKYGERPFQTQKNPDNGHVITHDIPESVIEAKVREILDGMKANSDPEKVAEKIEDGKVNEGIFEENDTNEESRQDVSINVSIPENVEKKDKNLDNKPKKRTIKPIK